MSFVEAVPRSSPVRKPRPIRGAAWLLAALVAAAGCWPVGEATAQSVAADACPSLLNHTFNRLQTGKPESLCQFRGNVVLIVNTASYCGFTHQYEGLEALYRKYKARGLVVVGFPSNDFGGQEPGTNHEIAEFCRLTYGVEFPMFEKQSVKSLKTNPLYAELLARTGTAPSWNFHKYLVDRNADHIVSFGTRVEPDNRDLTSTLEKMLADKPSGQKG